MDQEPLHHLIRSLRALGDPTGVSDAELLERFVATRDEAAFELLLWRHGPMVLGVCRRLLRREQDVEDAFQATFLALARKAGAIARGPAAGAWLYRVAQRVALRVRASLAKQALREQPGVDQLAAPSRGDPGWGDLRDVLDEEVERLPARYRAAFVLCCLEGKTGAEAARLLGCPPGTVSSRLTRARERLRRRLARRGLTPNLSGVAPVVPLPASLVVSTLKASLLFTTGAAAGGNLSARAVVHAEGVLHAMFLNKFKVAALLVLLLGLLAGGGLVARHALEAAPPDETREGDPTGRARDAEPGDRASPRPVTVRVVKPQPGGLERTTSQPCAVHAFDRADLYAVVSGVLTHQTVDLGSFVKKGQLLAEIDAPLLGLEQKQAEAAVQQAKGKVREGQAQVAGAQAAVDAAQSIVPVREAELASAKATVAFRQKELARFQTLLANRSIDASVLDEQKERLEAATAQVNAAQAGVMKARADLEVEKSKVAQAEAALETAKANVEAATIALEKARYALSLTRVMAPVDGVVTRRNYQDGDFVQASTQGSRTPLLTVEGIDRLRVVVEVPEGDAPLVERGTPVELTFDTLPGKRFSGYTVSRVAFALNPSTRTMRVEIDVPNPKQQLRPGMYGAATIHLGTASPRALRLPATCLAPLPSGEGHAVYVVRDGEAHQTPVQVGNASGTEVEVLSGVGPNDEVVADPKGLKGEVVPVEVKEKPDQK